MTVVKEIINKTKKYSEKEYAQWVSVILQVQKGGYGENDKLYGVKVPILRKIAKEYSHILYSDIETLLHNEYHEIRLLALFMLISKFKRNKKERECILNIYLNNIEYINNWDLVDMSAPYILGNFIYENRDRLNLLERLSNSSKLWEERIAIVSTQYLIKNGMYEPTIRLSEKYLTNPHHLIHKATGWMLRELGKKDIGKLYGFLDKYASRMPRTMLRYSIERLLKEERRYYLNLE